MAWTNSKLYTATVTDMMNNTTAIDANSDTFRVALFTNAITPDQTVASAATAFGAGVWAANEVFDAAEWPTGGEALTAVTSTFASNVYTFDAANTVSTGTSATLLTFFGCLVYDDTIANQGWAFIYLGGTQSLTDGTLTILWAASGISSLTL